MCVLLPAGGWEYCSTSHSLTLRTMLLMASAKKRFPVASNAMPKGWPTHALMAGPLSPTGSQWSDRKKEKLPAAVDLKPVVRLTCGEVGQLCEVWEV